MGNWIIRWNFNKPTYKPGENTKVSFWLENTGDTYLYISNLELDFDFGTYGLETISGMIPPRGNKFLGNVNLSLPTNVVGRKIFTINYIIHEYINDEWVNLGFYQSDKQYFVSIYPTPLYKVFVSRGLAIEDRAIGDPIVEMIKEWGFKTVTVGIEVQVPEDQVSTQTKQQIRKADGVIAIATPRFMDALTGLWRTFEWYHNEVGIAFGIDKPLLILKDRGIALGGLPSYLVTYQQTLSMEFDPYNLDEARPNLSTIMPAFREWVDTGRKQNFLDSLQKVLAGVGVVAIVSGIIGALNETSKK